MRDNAWTTLEEYEFLESYKPWFLKQKEICVVGPFLAEVSSAFLEKFPSRLERFPDRESLLPKIHEWFGNHTRDCVKGGDARYVLDLSGKANRRPIALQPAQAYSALYYKQDSPLRQEIKDLYELFKSGDAATLTLFDRAKSNQPQPVDDPETVSPTNAPTEETAPPANAGSTTANPETPALDPPTHRRRNKKSVITKTKVVPFVHFQQTIIREKLKTMSEEEAKAVENHIENTYTAAMNAWERPWLCPSNSNKAESELEKEYYERNIHRVNHSLQVVGEEVARQTPFKTFFMWGGPSAVSGSVEVTVAQTGETISGGQTFMEFLGPTFTEVEEKFRRWLQLSYTNDELQRRTVLGPPSPSVAPSPATLGTMTTVVPLSATPSTPAPPPPVVTPTLPPPAVTSAPPSPIVAPVPIVPTPLLLTITPAPPSPTVTPAPPLPTSTPVPPSPMIIPARLSPLITPALLSPLVGSEWTDPTSGPGSYPKFLTSEILEHLNGITNVPGWPDLVQNYVTFEIVSPSKSTTRLPSSGRPPVVDAWLNDTIDISRVIPDPTTYGESWKAWWTKCQPPVRAEGPWPFPHECGSDIQWGRLLNGGKHGVFLFVMALSWWARSLDPPTSSPELTEAISDLDWVIGQLIASFKKTPVSLPPPPPSTPEAEGTFLSKRKVKLTEKAMDGGVRVRKRFCRE